jgi:Response regulator of the LytR/AlgR family
MSFGILVVEDDSSFALEIEMMISELGYKYLGNPKNSFQTLEAIVKERPDLIILDININGGVDGITLAKAFAYKKIPVIYITGYESPEYFNRAKETDHIAYLVKPFHMLTLRSAIEKAFLKTQNLGASPEKTDALFVKNNNILHKIYLTEIKWIEVNGNYCYLFAQGKKHVLKMSLTKMLQNINKKNIFLQIHRNYIVQRRFITNYNSKNHSIKIDDSFIPVGRKYKNEVIALLKNN